MNDNGPCYSAIRDTYSLDSNELPVEESYIENILRMNKGKNVKVHMSFQGEKDKVFAGSIEASGRDHIIISDPISGKRDLLLMIYLDYVEFDDIIIYKI